MRPLFIATFLVSALLSTVGVKADIDPKRVHVVDYRLQTKRGAFPAIILRGNTPVNDAGTALNYTQWYTTLATNTQQQIGVVMAPPPQVYIIDVCFENEALDYQYKAEVDFWKDPANAAKGLFVPWILLGSMNYPPDFTPQQQQDMARNRSLWDIDQLPARVQKVRQMMLDGPPEGYSQLAIYFHCTHGQDRTGEFANAYRLTFHSTIQDGDKLAGYHHRRSSQEKQQQLRSVHLRSSSGGGRRGSGNADTASVASTSNKPFVLPADFVAAATSHLAAQNVENKKNANRAAVVVAADDTLTTMSRIYSLGCDEGLRCPMYTFTANAGWYCLWSNQFNGTAYTDCATSYSCIPLLFCCATNV